MPKLNEDKINRKHSCQVKGTIFLPLKKNQTISEFILEDGKLVSDGIPSNKIPSDLNFKTVKPSKKYVFIPQF